MPVISPKSLPLHQRIIALLGHGIDAPHHECAAEIRVTGGIERDDAMLIVPMAAVFNWAEPLLPAFIGAPALAWLT